LANKTNSSLILPRMQKDTVDDVLNYVSKKRHVPAVESK
jgi:hypothetical protein